MSSLVSRSALHKRKKDALSVKVALVGLNRMTGSLGMALRGISERPNTNIEFTVLGRDEDNEAMKSAHKIGAIDNFNKALQTVVEDADIVFVNVPMSQLDEVYSRMGDMLKSGAVVVDLSPLKQPSVKLADKYFPKDVSMKPTVYLVGATPLVGFDQLYATDLSVAASQEYLFRNSDILIAPHPSVPPEAVKVVIDIAELMNMKPRFMDPAEYDGLASLTEGIPLLLSLLMLQMVQQSPGKLDLLRAANPTFASIVQNLRHVNAKDMTILWRSMHESMLRQIDQTFTHLEGIEQLFLEKEPVVMETYLEQVLKGLVAWEVNREQNKWDRLENNPLDDIPVGLPMLGSMFVRRRNKDQD